mgnify:CR=1 FL=1
MVRRRRGSRAHCASVTHALSQWKAERVGRRGSHRARAVEADAELVAALVEKSEGNFMWLTSALADIKGGALRPQDAPSLPRGMGEMRLLQMGKKNKKSKKDVHAALRELFELDEGCKLEEENVDGGVSGRRCCRGSRVHVVHPVHGATRPHDRYCCARLQNGRQAGI